MSGPRKRGKAKNQRTQVAAAVLLCVAMAVVWGRAWRQLGSEATPAEAPGEFALKAPPGGVRPLPAATPPRQGGSPPVASLEAEAGADLELPRAWPVAEWESLIAADPMSFGAQAAAEETREAGAATGPGATEVSWEQRLATEDAVVMVAGGQKRLLLGADEYRVGDRVGNLIIEDITAGEVVLAPE